MKKNIVLIGLGEMGGVFARGFLCLGHPVYPVTRSMDKETAAMEITNPELVLVAVGENDLQDVLKQLPEGWRDQTVLLQNELLPCDWLDHHLLNPTIISVWFEKKKGQDYKVLIPSPAHGPKARVLMEALATINIACRIIDTDTDMLHELVLKNVYIVTTNIAGLVTGGTVSELWSQHQDFATRIAHEVIDIQEWLSDKTFDRSLLLKDMLTAFNGDPGHNCMGRSAPARLQRAIHLADKAGLDVPEMRKILARQ